MHCKFTVVLYSDFTMQHFAKVSATLTCRRVVVFSFFICSPFSDFFDASTRKKQMKYTCWQNDYPPPQPRTPVAVLRCNRSDWRKTKGLSKFSSCSSLPRCSEECDQPDCTVRSLSVLPEHSKRVRFVSFWILATWWKFLGPLISYINQVLM